MERGFGSRWQILLLVPCVAALVLQAGEAPAAEPTRSLSDRLSPMLNTLAAAANRGEVHEMRPWAVSGKGEVFPWARPAGSISILQRPEPWRVVVLEPPFTNGAEALAVFHTWHMPEADGDHIHPLTRTEKGWRVLPEIPERDTQGYRIRRHSLNITLDPARRAADITDDLEIERGEGARPVVFLRLSNDFTVRKVTSSGAAVPFRQAGGVVAARPPAGKAIRLRLVYDGRVVHRAVSSIEPDYALLNAYYYPTLGRLPATAETRLRVPKGWLAVTQGNLADHAETNAGAVFRYVNDLPVNTYSIAAGRYTETRRQAGNVTLAALTLDAEPRFVEGVLDTLENALDYFQSRFGPYPYARYTVADGGQVMGFMALEGYSMATYGSVMFNPATVAHELSHTWWGGVAPNTYLRSWWNESFATYSEDAYLRVKNGISEPHPTDRPWWPSGAAVSTAPLATARHNDNPDAIAYRKGAVVLRLMEEQAGGQEAFDRILRAFLADSSRLPDPDWPDFQRAAERVTGRDWAWFFEQWINRTGWPALRLDHVMVQALPDDTWSVTARIAQDGLPYALAVPVRLETVEGGQTSIVELRHGNRALRDATVVFTARATPKALRLDPTFEIPRWMGADDVATFDDDGGVIYAASREEAR